MKKILFLLLVTIAGYGQTLQNPTFGNTTTNTLKIKTPATVTSVNFLSTVESDGSIAKIAPVNLPFVHLTGDEEIDGEKTFLKGIYVADGPSVFSNGVAIGKLAAAEALDVEGRALVSMAPIVPTGVARKLELDEKANLNTFNLFTENSRFYKNAPTFLEFRRSDVAGTAQVSVGMLGAPEANLSFNMDYTTNVHKYYDPTMKAMWLALSGDVFALQYAPAGEPTGGDMWNSSGQNYLFWGDSSGKFIVNTNVADNKGDAQFSVKRLGGMPSIGGFGDLIIEGDRVKGTSANVLLNAYNSGNVLAVTGGGNFGVNTLSPDYTFDVEGIGRIKRTGVNGIGGAASLFISSDAKTIGDAITIPIQGHDSADSENPYSSVSAVIDSPTAGAQSGHLVLKTYNAGSSVDAMTLSKEGNAIINGTATASPATLSTELVTKGQLDTKVLSASYTPTVTASTNVTSATLGTASYTKIGNIVTGTISLSTQATAINLLSEITMTVPVNRVGTVPNYYVGTGTYLTNSDFSAGNAFFVGSSANTITLRFNSGLSVASSGNCVYTFQYDITK